MRKRTGFLLILFMGLYLAAAAREFSLHTNVSDDSLWYYYIGSGITKPSSFDRERNFLPVAKEIAEDEITWRRLYLRAGYTGNYLIPTLACFHVGNSMAEAMAPDAPLTERLSLALNWGYIAALIVGAAFAVFGFLRSSRELQLALVTALGMIAGLDLLSVDGGIGVLASSSASLNELKAIAYRLTLILIDPHYAIAPFGAMARNQIIFLALGVYALRWSGKPAAAYAFMIVLLLFHQSMAFLLLASLLTVDAVTRPRIFRDLGCAAAAGAALAIALLREAHWAGIGSTGWIVLAISALVAFAAIGLLIFALRGGGASPSRVRDAYGRWLELWRMKSEVATDVLGLSTVFLVALVVAAVANELAQPFSQQYFWSILPGRLFALLRPLYFLALALWVIGWLARSAGPVSRTAISIAALAAFAALMAVEVRLTPSINMVRERMAGDLAKLDASLGRPSSVFRIEDEPLFYYALVKSLHTNNDYLRDSWPARAPSPASPPAPARDKIGK